jgi:hypothetical protein
MLHQTVILSSQMARLSWTNFVPTSVNRRIFACNGGPHVAQYLYENLIVEDSEILRTHIAMGLKKWGPTMQKPY